MDTAVVNKLDADNFIKIMSDIKVEDKDDHLYVHDLKCNKISPPIDSYSGVSTEDEDTIRVVAEGGLRVEGLHDNDYGILQFDRMHAQIDSSGTIYCGSHMSFYNPVSNPMMVPVANPNKLYGQEAIIRTVEVDYLQMRDALTTAYDTNIITFGSNIV